MSALRKGIEKEFVAGTPRTTSPLPSFQETVRWREASLTQECFPLTDKERGEKQAQMRILGNAKWLPYGACCHGNTLLQWTTLGTGCKELQRSITKAAT